MSSRAAPTVRVPDSFSSASLPPPDLSGSPQITLRDWRSWSDGASTLAAGCFDTRATSWSGEVTELAEQKLFDVSLGTALRVRDSVGMRIASHEVQSNVRQQQLEGDGVRGRTFLGFRDGDVNACIVVCVGARAEAPGSPPSCADAIASSRLEGTYEPPPEPGVGLSALLYAVHHPRPVALVFAAVVVVAGIVSIWRRPRGRRTQHF